MGLHGLLQELSYTTRNTVAELSRLKQVYSLFETLRNVPTECLTD
jgi:hypothetical protein